VKLSSLVVFAGLGGSFKGFFWLHWDLCGRWQAGWMEEPGNCGLFCGWCGMKMGRTGVCSCLQERKHR
jgi:hypothetical protein